jgi:predicted transcriptional regulator
VLGKDKTVSILFSVFLSDLEDYFKNLAGFNVKIEIVLTFSLTEN